MYPAVSVVVARALPLASRCKQAIPPLFSCLINPLVLATLIGLVCHNAANLPSAGANESTPDSSTAKVSYDKQIEPILRKNCFGCHQGAKQLGDYRMTDFESLLAGGESEQAAIVPGKPDKSYLIELVTSHDGVAEMPKAPAKPLHETEVQLIGRWIKQGAIDDRTDHGQRFDKDHLPTYQAQPSLTSIDVSPDGKLIAIGGYHETFLLDAAVGTLRTRLVGMSPRMNSVSFSQDGSRLAAVGGSPGEQGEVQIWDTKTHELLLSKTVTYDALCGAAWSPDGTKLAFGAADNVVRAIDTTSGEQVLFQGAHEDWIRDLAFSPDGSHLVSVARDMSCKLTEVATERFVDNVTSITPGALSGGLNSIAMHPKRNEIVVGGADGVAKVYRIFRETARKIGDDANLIRKLSKLDGRIFDVDFSTDGNRIAAVATLNGTSQLRVWGFDFDTKLSDELKKIIAKRISDRSAEEKKKVAEYREQETKELTTVQLGGQVAYSIAFGPDDTLYVTTDQGLVRRVAADGSELEPIRLPIDLDSGDAEERRFDAMAFLKTMRQTEPEKLDLGGIVSIDVYPTTIESDSPYDYTQLVVTAKKANGELIDATRAVTLETTQGIVTTNNGLVWPTQDTDAKLTVSLGQHQVVVPIKASGISGSTEQVAEHVDFVKDVNPVLSRLGCNQGTCHGAQKGKNGFKLSLRGYDPIFDVRALTDDLAARRINASAPEDSLMLRKPLGLTPHEGGVLMTAGDPYHSVLRRWIANGCQLNEQSPRVIKLEIYPLNPVVQSIGSQQQVRLLAYYSDDTTRDVTREAFVESGNTEVATSSGSGLLKAIRRGEAPILARFEGRYAATTMTVMGDREGYQPSDYETWGPIDERVAEKWDRVKVVPSGLCDDATFLRRVTLDLTGLPPTAAEVRAFLNDTTPTRQKRAQIVDRLLSSEASFDYWTNKWADLLQVNRKFLGVEGSRAFREWIRNAVAENRPYDQFVREILTAKGSNRENPAASYFKVLRNPEDTMENTTHLFLGIRFNCNKCHDHPFERWTQDQYYEMAAYFARVDLQKDPESGNKRIGGTAVEGAKPLYEKVVDKNEGEIVHARTGKVTAPEFPYQVDCQIPDDATRRERLAAWMTDADNPYFAKSFVNRLWGYLLGKGLIEPIDDIRAGNPPTNPALLDYLTERFVDSGFDIRSTLREICNSRTYQLNVETNPFNEDDTLNYARAIPRRLPAEVIYDAVHALTGSTTEIPGMPKGTRAAAITDAGVKLADGFLQNLGRPVRESACECERSSDLQLGPIMALIGGPTVASAIADPQNELERIVADNQDDRDLANEIFLRSIGREPTEAEYAAFEQVKQQIQLDHEALTQQLAQAEAQWSEQKAELESLRMQKLDEAKAQLAARIEAAKPEQDRLAKEREQRIAEAEKKLETANGKLDAKADEFVKQNRDGIDWHPLLANKATSTNKAKFAIGPDRVITASENSDKGTYTLEFPTSLKHITGLRLEAISDPSLPAGGPGLPPNGNFVITEIEVKSASQDQPGELKPVAIASGHASFLQGGFTIEATFDGNPRDQRGWAIAGATGMDQWATLKFKQPIENPSGALLQIQLHQYHNAKDHRLGKFRISATTVDGDIPLDLSDRLKAIALTPKANRSDESKKTLVDFVGKNDAERKQAIEAVAAAKKAVPRDAETVRLEKLRDRLSKPTPDDPSLVRLREDAKFSEQQIEKIRLTAAEDLTWALINSPAFLFNH
ncbi:DUF1549 domain-containing protein [Roseiconus lacunae]|uniref:DUF1549 domain-containing protein n=1 Tax=Roseiconus lacunae TaxID=2605694 RepID=A0ABT7PPU1_9BACT|nr:DUF1549 domain-containing protein [Roseiconus lacunae]MDM4018368.1 DUF1549 domain-containing protein [Roseiconus lacunae]